MPTIWEMTSGTAAIEVAFNRLVVKAEYYPGKITERIIQKMRDLSRMNDGDLTGFADLNAMIVELIASWDLTENDGVTMFPLDAERLPELPVQFRIKVLTAALKDMRPNE